MRLTRVILDDVRINRKAGLFCLLLLLLYRLGHKLVEIEPESRAPIRWLIILGIHLLNMPKNILAHSFGSFIPFEASLGSGVEFKHGFYGVFLSQSSRIGDNAVFYHQVTVGSYFDQSRVGGAPTIGANATLGAGAMVIGRVIIGDNVRIGANATVVDDLPDNATVVSQKARVIIRT